MLFLIREGEGEANTVVGSSVAERGSVGLGVRSEVVSAPPATEA